MNYLSLLLSLFIALQGSIDAFTIIPASPSRRLSTAKLLATVPSTSSTKTSTTYSFIDEALRGAAMKLHTREQAPKEGQLQGPDRPPYTPDLDDYLSFLVDSQHVYQTLENLVNTTPDLEKFRNTGLERTQSLEKDIEHLVHTYKLTRPDVGEPGRTYAELLQTTVQKSLPAFVCHYYNHYFAHTAGGRMIGKKMSSLLLNGATLEFYKWDSLNDSKQAVKETIEAMAAQWTEEERDECVQATSDAFAAGGALNSYLSHGKR